MDTQVIENLLGEYSWVIITGFVFLMARSTIESIIEALKVFIGKDLNTDYVIILDERPARVVIVCIFKTILFVYEIGCANGKPFVKGGKR